MGQMPLLVPGIGAQGGDVEAVLKLGLDQEGQGLIISSSREILYAHERSIKEPLANTKELNEAGILARQTRDLINKFR